MQIIHWVGRSLGAMALCLVLAGLWTTTFGVDVNVDYHAALDAELQQRMAAGERLRHEDVLQVGRKYAYLREAAPTGVGLLRGAVRQAAIPMTLVWMLAFWSQPRTVWSLAALATLVFVIQRSTNAFDAQIGAIWLVAAATGMRSSKPPANAVEAPV
jgi:hypothetical protein